MTDAPDLNPQSSLRVGGFGQNPKLVQLVRSVSTDPGNSE
jgi:hypothetical protein